MLVQKVIRYQKHWTDMLKTTLEKKKPKQIKP